MNSKGNQGSGEVSLGGNQEGTGIWGRTRGEVAVSQLFHTRLPSASSLSADTG